MKSANSLASCIFNINLFYNMFIDLLSLLAYKKGGAMSNIGPFLLLGEKFQILEKKVLIFFSLLQSGKSHPPLRGSFVI